MGPNASAEFTPSAAPLCVRRHTSHPLAVKFIHVPIAETNWPDRNSRKFREERADAKVLRSASAMPARHERGRIAGGVLTSRPPAPPTAPESRTVPPN